MMKTFIMLQKISISGKCCSSELSIHQRNLKKILLICFQHNNNKCFFFFLAANQNIRMISEGSCDWNNDAKNSVLKSQEYYILKYIQIESYFK